MLDLPDRLVHDITFINFALKGNEKRKLRFNFEYNIIDIRIPYNCLLIDTCHDTLSRPSSTVRRTDVFFVVVLFAMLRYVPMYILVYFPIDVLPFRT